jgi:hypothetical protein
VGPGFSPLDEALALPAGRFTPQLHEWMVRLGTWVPFAPAAQLLAAFSGVVVPESTVRRATEAAGARWIGVQTAAVEAIERDLPQTPADLTRAVVEVDGAMIPLRGGEWAEVRTLVLGEQPPLGDPAPRTGALSYFSRLMDAASFERASLVETQRRGLERAEAVAGVADGAEWVQSWLDTHCPQAVRILDFAHAVEHISVIASAVWGEGSGPAQTWVAAQARWLKRTGPAWLLGEVRDLVAGQPENEVLRRELAYLEKRATAMEYAQFRAAGWPLGSGVVESGNKTVVEGRLKGAGMRWARAHVNPLLGLRNVVCNDRWAESWAQIGAQEQAVRARRQRGEQAAGRPTPGAAGRHGATPAAGSSAGTGRVSAGCPTREPPQGQYARAGSTPQDGREPWRPAANHPWKRPFRTPRVAA